MLSFLSSGDAFTLIAVAIVAFLMGRYLAKARWRYAAKMREAIMVVLHIVAVVALVLAIFTAFLP